MPRLVAISIAALAISACGQGAPPAQPTQTAATETPAAPSAAAASSAPIPGVPFTCADLAAALTKLDPPNRMTGEAIPEAEQDFSSAFHTAFTLSGAASCTAYQGDAPEAESFGYTCEFAQPSIEAAKAAQKTFAAAIAACYPGGKTIPNLPNGPLPPREDRTERTVSAERPDLLLTVDTRERTFAQALAAESGGGEEEGGASDASAKPAAPSTPVVAIYLEDSTTLCEILDDIVADAPKRLREMTTKSVKPRRINADGMLGALDLCSTNTETGGFITCRVTDFAQADADYGKCLKGWTRTVIPTENFITGVELGQSIEYAGGKDGEKLVIRLLQQTAPDPAVWWREIRLQ